MKLSEFKKLHQKFSNFPLGHDLISDPEYDIYLHALKKKRFSDWCIKEEIKKNKINYKLYCCLDMAYHLIEGKKKQSKPNFDAVIIHTHGRNEFGIPIHDGGSSYIRINFCPWCGSWLGRDNNPISE